jgi:hypothetical protein
MHGHIAVRTTPGTGSTFALLLPVLPLPEDEDVPPRSVEEASASA